MFKAVNLYKITVPLKELLVHETLTTHENDSEQLDLPENRLHRLLAAFQLPELTDQVFKATGFVSPFDSAKGDSLVFRVGNNLIACVKSITRKIPKSFLEDRLHAMIKEFLATNNLESVTARQKRTMKEELTKVLLPSMPPISKSVLMALDLDNDIVIIASSSLSESETCLSMLRKALGSLPATVFFDTNKFHSVTLEWLKDVSSLPEGLSVGYNATLSTFCEDNSVVKFKNVDLRDDDVQRHLNDKLCTQMELSVHELGSFTINDAGTLKGIKLDDVYKESNYDASGGDFIARLEADAILDLSSILAITSRLSAIHFKENKPK